MYQGHSSRFWLLVVVLFLPSPLFASGYIVPEQGAGAMGNANASVARGLDASANWFNPAALTQIQGTQGMVGFTFIDVDGEYKGKNSSFEDEKSPVEDAYVPHVYGSHQFHSNAYLGFGFITPYGLVSDWGEDWQGQRIITKAELRVTILNANLAFSTSDTIEKKLGGLRMSFGIGANMGFGKFQLGRRVPQDSVSPALGGSNTDAFLKIIGGGDSDIPNMDQDIVGFGYNAGMLLEFRNLSFGVSYRSKIKFEANGDEAAQANFYGVAPAFTSVFVDQKVTTEIETPDIVMLGLAYRHGKFEFEFDAWWTNWSVFDELRLDFEDNTLDNTIEEKWHSSWAYRFGLRYYVYGAPHSVRVGGEEERASNFECGSCSKLVKGTVTECPHCGAEFSDLDTMAEKSSPKGSSYRTKFPKNQMYINLGLFYDNTPVPDETVSPILPDSDRYGFTLGFGFKRGNIGADIAVMFLFSDDREKNNLEGTESGSVNDPHTANGTYKQTAILVGFSAYINF